MEFEKPTQDQIFDYLMEIIFNKETKIYDFNRYNYKYRLDNHEGSIVVNHKPSTDGFLVLNLNNKCKILYGIPEKDDDIEIKIYQKQNRSDELLDLVFFENMRKYFPEENLAYDSFLGRKSYVGTIRNVESIKVLLTYRVENKLFFLKSLVGDGDVSTEQQREYFRLIKEYATQQM